MPRIAVLDSHYSAVAIVLVMFYYIWYVIFHLHEVPWPSETQVYQSSDFCVQFM